MTVTYLLSIDVWSRRCVFVPPRSIYLVFLVFLVYNPRNDSTKSFILSLAGTFTGLFFLTALLKAKTSVENKESGLRMVRFKIWLRCG